MLSGQLGFEIAFDKQKFDNGYFSLFSQVGGIDQGAISLDVNSHYPSGEPNPNLGRPYASARGRAVERESDRETSRFTAYAKIDLQEKVDGFLGEILGHHAFTGLYNSQSVYRSSYTFLGVIPDSGYRVNFWNSPSVVDVGRASDSRVMYYLGPSLKDASSPVGAGISNIKTSSIIPSSIPDVLVYHPEEQQFVRTPVTFTTYQNNRLGHALGATKTLEEIDSKALIWQGHLLNNLLVGTIGWRNDQADSFNAGSAPRAFDDHLLIEDQDFLISSEPQSSVEGDTWTYSAVMKVPESAVHKIVAGADLRFHYNQSENFLPATSRFNAIGEALPPPGGETEELGFTFSLFDGKLAFKANWFETIQNNITNSAINAGSIIGNDLQFYQANIQGVNDDLPGQVAAFTLPPQEILDFYGWEVLTGGVVTTNTQGKSIVGITNRKADGFEFELAYNPTSNWALLFNASQFNATQSGVDEGFATLLALRQPIWEAAPDLLDASANFRLEDRSRSGVLDGWNAVRLADGTPVRELREWRWNLITNYQFDNDTMLKGISVGGAMRWLDKPALGLPPFFSDLLDEYALDPTNPYFGSSEFNADVWISYNRRIFDDKVEWKLQLNVRNIIGEDNLIPIAVQPDGSVLNGRIPSGTGWVLSSRFKF